MKGRDGGTGRIDFVDISTPSYSAARNAGLSFEQAMGEIHAILPDGSVVTKVRREPPCCAVVKGLVWRAGPGKELSCSEP